VVRVTLRYQGWLVEGMVWREVVRVLVRAEDACESDLQIPERSREHSHHLWAVLDRLFSDERVEVRTAQYAVCAAGAADDGRGGGAGFSDIAA